MPASAPDPIGTAPSPGPAGREGPLPIHGDPIRSRTSRAALARIDDRIRANLFYYAGQGRAEMSERIAAVQAEWSVERMILVGASAHLLAGLYLGRKASARWYAWPAVVAILLLLYAWTGWCPPLPILRRLGFRSAREIAFEEYVLRLLRGDFSRGESGWNPPAVEDLLRSLAERDAAPAGPRPGRGDGRPAPGPPR